MMSYQPNQSKLRNNALSQILNEQPYKKSRKYKASKNRNDHSLQKKSPIKLPQSTPKKSELTFRNNSDHLPSLMTQNRVLQDSKTSQQVMQSRMSVISKKSTISQKELPMNNHKASVSIQQYQLVDHLWEKTIQLGNYSNPIFSKFIFQLQNTLRQMIKSFAYMKMDQEVIAMASSQKIKLRNFQLASNHGGDTQKQLEFEESRASQNQTIEAQLSLKNKDSQQKTTIDDDRSSQPKTTPKQSTQQLELKKILYMIEGKNQTKGLKNKINLQQNLGSAKKNNNNFYYQSYSSFNQNPSQDSGYTIMQIDKQNENAQMNMAIDDQMQLASQITIKSMRSNLSNQSYRKNEKDGSTKHKVLQDIIGMLNKKYKKNIQLI